MEALMFPGLNGAGLAYRLADLRPGDTVSVSRTDGSGAVFTVHTVAAYPKADFPTREVYGAVDHAALRLITCGGTFDRRRGRYRDNVVVFAALAPRGSVAGGRAHGADAAA